MKPFTVLCPECATPLVDGEPAWSCPSCSFTARGGPAFAELGVPQSDETADHYTLQWSEDTGFLKFLQGRPEAKASLASAELGWDALFAEIRERAVGGDDVVRVYDAACGFGGIANELVTEQTAANLRYLGADVHESLEDIPGQIAGLERCGQLVRWDISEPVPVRERFDYVICRSSLHHTPEPEKTLASLRQALSDTGRLAISVYRKKALCREALDDRLRDAIVPMSPEQALAVSREFTVLGRALQGVEATVEIPEGLEFLGIPKGEHDVQRLVYYHLLKCFYNEDFGERFSTLVNYDWYHPPYAYRYSADEVEALLDRHGLEVVELSSSAAQHFAVARARG